MPTKPQTPLDVRWDARPIRQAVEDSGMDAVEIAMRLRERTGRRVSPGAVRTWLIGAHEPPATMFLLIAEMLGRHPNSLMGMAASARPSARASAKRASS